MKGASDNDRKEAENSNETGFDATEHVRHAKESPGADAPHLDLDKKPDMYKPDALADLVTERTDVDVSHPPVVQNTTNKLVPKPEEHYPIKVLSDPNTFSKVEPNTAPNFRGTPN